MTAKTKKKRNTFFWPLLTYHSPPEGVREAVDVLVVLLLHDVDDERGEDEAQEPDVDGRDQFLERGRDC